MRWAVAFVGLLSVWYGWYNRYQNLNDLSIYDEADWWDPSSPFRVLRRMNDVRVDFFANAYEGGGMIVDLGCGGGFVTEELARAFPNSEVRGFDISENSVKKATNHADGLKNLLYSVGDIYAIPLQNESASFVVVSDVFEHLQDLDSALGEIARILKPGGVLVFDTIEKTWWSWLSTYFVGQQILGLVVAGAHDWDLFVSIPTLVDALTKAGFETDPSRYSGIVPRFSFGDCLQSGSLIDVIAGFEKSENDLSANYMGLARKIV